MARRANTGGSSAGMPPVVAPMLTALGSPPSRGEGVAWEMKWDGARCVAGVAGQQVRLTSRTERDVTGTYPEMGVLAELLDGRSVLLDGELVALDEAGRPRFSLLQERMHVRAPSPALLRRVPVRFYVFDLLYLDGEAVMRRPYRRRRELLDGLGLRHERVQVPPYWEDVDGEQMLQVAHEHGLEGVIAKRVDGQYYPGRRSPAWTKTPLRRSAEVIVCGWTPGEGRRRNMIGSLLLGAYDDQRRLVYVGHVGTGFTDAMLRQLHQQLGDLARSISPFDSPVPRARARDAHWVTPHLVGEVEYRELTTSGHLRHPSWRGLRADKSLGDIHLPH